MSRDQALLGRLEQAFPTDRLFIDVDNIPPGEDFVRMLESQVAQCDAMLTVIGNGWLGATDERGNRRLDDPDDFVRIEIASALKQGKRVIPVLVHDARMPHPEELPEAIRPLASRNAVRLTHERFRADVQGLIRSLRGTATEVAISVPDTRMDETLNPAKRLRLSFRSLTTFGVLAIVVVGSAVIWLENSQITFLSPQTAPVQPAAPRSASPQSSMAAPQVPATPAQSAATDASSSPQAANATSSEAKTDEIALWNSIKDEKNQGSFEAYLDRYPNGAFADIARIAIDNLKAAALTAPAQQTDDSTPITDVASLHELRERLYELNFDPGPLDGPLTDAAHQATRKFQQQINLPPTGAATIGVYGGYVTSAASSLGGQSSSVRTMENGAWRGMRPHESRLLPALAPRAAMRLAVQLRLASSAPHVGLSLIPPRLGRSRPAMTSPRPRKLRLRTAENVARLARSLHQCARMAPDVRA